MISSIGSRIIARSMSTSVKNNLRVSLCQVKVTADKDANIQHVAKFLDNAANNEKAELVVLPEIWNSPYSNASFPVYAEKVPAVGGSVDAAQSPSTALLCNKAKEHKLWLVGGSIPERVVDSGKENLYNTCVVVNPDGEIVAKHRKVHLFDIDVPGRITFRESDSLTAGSSATLFDTPWGKIGVGICYDIRFPEYAMILRQRGVRMLIYPGAFNMVTGPAHWELLQRARAVDTQCFVAACSPARDEDPNAKGYIPWGHSSVIAPWGDVAVAAGPFEQIITTDIDFEKAETMRQNIPCWSQKRTDLYEIVDKQTAKL